MLYDQAQLINSYLDAYQLTNDPFFEKTARSIKFKNKQFFKKK